MADIYVVERILDKRIIDDQIHYYLKWFGFGDDECTWEPEENVFCTDLVKDFERKQQEKQHEKELLQERKNGENVFDECAQTITSILNETESATSAKILNHIIEEKVEKSLLSIREDEQLSSKTTNNQSNDTTATSISDFESLLLAIKIDENRSQQQLMPATIINNVDEENNRTSSDDTYYSFDGGKNIEIEEDNADNDVKQISNISDDDLGMSSDSQKTIEYQVNQRSDDENLMKENDTDEENRESSVSNNYSKEQNAQIKPKINNLNGTPSADIIDETNQVLSMNDDEIVSDDHQLLEDIDLRSSNQHHLESLSFLEKRCTRKHHLANDENWRQLKRRRLQDEIQASPSSKSSSNSLVDENGNHLVKDNKLDAGHSYGKKLEMSEKQKLSETTGAAQSTSKPATFDFLGLEPEEIVCITRSKSTELQFLLKCAKCPNKLFYITNRQATEIIPQLVIQFYERHIDWFNIKKKSTTNTTTKRSATVPTSSHNKYKDKYYQQAQKVNTRLQTRKSAGIERSLSISYDNERQMQQEKTSAESPSPSEEQKTQKEQQQLKVTSTRRSTTNDKINTLKKRQTKSNRSTTTT